MFNRRNFVLLSAAFTLCPMVARAQQPPSPMPIVTIDPGHGGADWGATDGIKEKDAVLAISLKVAEILRVHGVRAVLTRNGDYFVPLDDRVKISEQNRSQLFVSIHANYLNRPEARGIETWIAPSRDSRLAVLIQSSIVRRLGAVDRGVKSARFLVLRKSVVPAVLVETGFISNQIECTLLKTPEYRYRMADAIARGILEYLGIQLKQQESPALPVLR